MTLHIFIVQLFIFFFLFTDTDTTEIYTLSLHDALPIYIDPDRVEIRQLPIDCDDRESVRHIRQRGTRAAWTGEDEDRKSTRLNSSHVSISYAVFCLKKKTLITITQVQQYMINM